MKALLFIPYLLFSFPQLAISQNNKTLTGTWYGKVSTYEFQQYGTAQCYSKTAVKNYKQKLVIDKDLNYTYTEFKKTDSLVNKGHVIPGADTLIFMQTETNNKGLKNPALFKYFLFHLGKGQLIYSVFPIEEIKEIEDDSENKIFQKVEVDAEYRLGKNQFLKAIYSSLAKKKAEDKDLVSLNSYIIIIDKNGNPDINTLQIQDGKTAYTEAVKEAFVNLKTNFIPAKQNGRFITGRHFFKFTY